ncbi:M23 family metallopeptidase [Plantibacter flavus]|uniref:M23 family metallopeptidase n=1 Tax=Plantibacter flavus TaxID=150123 RepID=UPI003F5CC479
MKRDGYSATSAEEVERRRSAVPPARTATTFINNAASPVQWPFVTGVPLSDDFGPRAAPCGGCSTFHKGLDLTPGEGTQIQAIADGIVRETGSSDSGLGVYAMIDHVVDGERYTSVYAHMRFGSLKLQEGERVGVGQAVGNVGNTGQSTGPHLHLELLRNGTDPIDPFSWLQANVQLS